MSAYLNWITVKKMSELSGITIDAINSNRKKGYWREGIHWRKAPNGRIFININAVEKWIEGIEA